MRRMRSKERAGFTLIEVMVSLGVMTVGAMAIIALQQHSIRSNVHSRKLSIATSIAERWVERLKQDAHTWNRAADPTVPNDDVAVLSNTQFLQEIVGSNFANFQTIDGATATASRAFSWDGRDVDLGSAAAGDITYCASFRLGWVLWGRAMRADVRVWWARTGLPNDPGQPYPVIGTDFPGCQENAALDPGGTLSGLYHVVYMPSVIRMTTVER